MSYATEKPVNKLDAAPFTTWLRLYIDTEHEGDSQRAAECLGVSKDYAQKLANGPYKKVMLDMVDRVFCAAGQPWMLRELYPHLYDFPELAA